ncbi:cytochrome P450 monooxygenase pc-1 [Mycena amicta]|nr:cytochrome P450 monooxygenase pc-1 [Mycena amicta]
MLTPGVEFLLGLALNLTKPALLGLALHHGFQRLANGIPLWATALLSIASIPVYAAYSVWSTDRRQGREAEAMGARLAPRVQGKWPGNLDLLRRMLRNRIDGYPADNITEFMEKHGPVVNVRILWRNMIITMCPEHIKCILATDFDNYEKGARFHKTMHSVLGTGVFNSDGEMWKFHRGMTRPFFSKERISHFDTLDTHAELVVSSLQSRSRAGHAIDFQDLIGRFTMDSATEMLFGTCFDSLKGSIPYAHNATANAVRIQHTESRENTFVAAFNDAMEGIAIRDQRGVLAPLSEIWWDCTREPMAIVSAFLDPIIEAAVERKRVADAMGGEKREAQNLLDELLDATSDPKILKDETLNILLAGRDTTMHTLTMVIYFLSIYPAVCLRLRAEVLAHVGPTRRPAYDDIKNMKYLRAVINASVDETLYSVFLMQRRKDLWGPDADEFDPDRFLDERLKKYLLTNSFQFLPFNAGPRICLGQQFAYNEMSFMLIRLLQAFSAFHLDEEAFPPGARPPAEWKHAQGPGRKSVERFRPKVNLTMSTMGGMWVRVTEAMEEV